MGSILNEVDREKNHHRVGSLSVSSTARWGTMGVVNMVEHLRRSARMAVGELPVPSVKQASFSAIPSQASHHLRTSFPEGSADSTGVETRSCGIS
jgi:hypothetical protein